MQYTIIGLPYRSCTLLCSLLMKSLDPDGESPLVNISRHPQKELPEILDQPNLIRVFKQSNTEDEDHDKPSKKHV